MTEEVWMGYLVDHCTNYTVVQSPFVLGEERVFGADSDATTLSVAAILHRLQHDAIASVAVPDGIDADTVSTACNVHVWDEESEAGPEWDLLLSEEAIIVLARPGADVEISVMDIAVEVDRPFNEAILTAWEMELNTLHVSQGAYVSQAQYVEAASPRVSLSGQIGANGPVWPPRYSAHGPVNGNGVHKLTPNGHVLSWTTLSAAGSPSEFSLRAPLLGGVSTVLLELTDGPNGVFLIVDDEEPELSMDAPMELVVRRIYAQEGFIRYGLKARPMSA